MYSYVYKFEDKNKKVLYIGKTNNMNRRMAQHFGNKGHIKGDCYKRTRKIYYMTLSSEENALIVEQYFISKYKPPYNIKGKGKPALRLNINENWILYKKINKEYTVIDLLLDVLAIGLVVGTVICIFL